MFRPASAVHTGRVTVRDHYTGFAMTLSIGAGSADIEAIRVAGSGGDVLPDFSHTVQFPVTMLNLFEPGIASFESLNNDCRSSEEVGPIGPMTPESVRLGRAAAIVEQRQRMLDEAYGAKPDRFVRDRPKPARLPMAAWINPPVVP